MTVCTVHLNTWMYNEHEYIWVELGSEQLFYIYRYKFYVSVMSVFIGNILLL